MPALLPLGWSIIPGYIIGENQPFGPLNVKMNASEYVDAVVNVVRVLATGFSVIPRKSRPIYNHYILLVGA